MRRALVPLIVGAAAGFALGLLFLICTEPPLIVGRLALEVLEFWHRSESSD